LVGLIWTRHQPVEELATYTEHNKHNVQTYPPSAGFEPAIPAIDEPQNYALNHTTTGIGYVDILKDVKQRETGNPSTASY
jgi:hypothetical protein